MSLEKHMLKRQLTYEDHTAASPTPSYTSLTQVEDDKLNQSLRHSINNPATASLFGSNLVINVIPPDAGDISDTESHGSGGDRTPFHPPDGGWGWVVCLASFWTNGTIFGVLNIFGILYVHILKEFDDGQENLAFKTSWVGSLQISMTFLLSPVASILVDQIGIRPVAFIGGFIATIGMVISSFVTRLEVLYLTYGLLMGLGSSLVYTPSMVILGHYFRARLGIVNGIVASGSAVFTMILPILLKYLLAEIGLRNTMRILAGFQAVLMLCALTFKPLYHSRQQQKHSKIKRQSACSRQIRKICNFNIWKNSGYVVWAIALPVSFLGYFIPFVHLTNHTKLILPGSNAELLVTCMGATTGISRLICGKVADFPSINRVRMQQVSFLVLGIATSCIPFAHRYGMLIAIVLLMGLCDGCFVCLLGPIAFDLLGPSGAPQGLGCLLGLMSLPMTAGPPIAGFMYDQMSSYHIAFLIAGIPPIVGAILLFLMPYKYQTRVT